MGNAVAKITKLIVYSTVTLCSCSVNTDMVSCRPLTKKHRHETKTTVTAGGHRGAGIL